MNSFVKVPNLPVDAKHVLLGAAYRDMLDGPLRKLGISPVYVPDNPLVDPRLRGHVDLSVFHVGSNRVYLAPYLYRSTLEGDLRQLGCDVRFVERQPRRTYPQDVPLNVCIWGDHWIGSSKAAAKEILEECEKMPNATWVPVKQGYTKCACCVVDPHAMICADKGIISALPAPASNILEVSPGAIALPGFPYGFLGGSAFKIGDRRLAFTGHLAQFPEKTEVLRFLSARSIEAIFLTDQPIFDIGGAIPLTEKS